MALVGFEGFDHYPSVIAINSSDSYLHQKPFSTGQGRVSGGVWTGNPTNLTSGGGLLGGRAAFCNSSSMNMVLQFANNYTTLYCGCRLFTPPSLSSGVQILSYLDNQAQQCGFTINSSGKLICWRGTTATVLATGSATYLINNWYQFSFRLTVDPSNGIIQAQQGGVDDIPLTSGLNTRNTANSRSNGLNMACTQNSASTGWDDLWADDANLLGVVRVETTFPTANDAVVWTPNSGTNFSRVNEVAVDDDTTYNASSTSGDQDTFVVGALSSTPATVYGVSVSARVRKDDVSVQNAQTVLKSGAATQLGTSQPPTTSYLYQRDLYTTDPNTGLAWTGAAAGACKIGYKHV